MSNSFENPLATPAKEVDPVADAFKNLSKDLNEGQELKKNTFTPEGWFIHEAKGTETREEVKALPEFADSSDEEIEGLFEKYADKFSKEPISLDKAS